MSLRKYTFQFRSSANKQQRVFVYELLGFKNYPNKGTSSVVTVSITDEDKIKELRKLDYMIDLVNED